MLVALLETLFGQFGLEETNLCPEFASLTVDYDNVVQFVSRLSMECNSLHKGWERWTWMKQCATLKEMHLRRRYGHYKRELLSVTVVVVLKILRLATIMTECEGAVSWLILDKFC